MNRDARISGFTKNAEEKGEVSSVMRVKRYGEIQEIDGGPANFKGELKRRAVGGDRRDRPKRTKCLPDNVFILVCEVKEA